MKRRHIRLVGDGGDGHTTKNRSSTHIPSYLPVASTEHSPHTMYPTRSAPRPPRETASLPPNHPFATSLKPFGYHANSSTSSLHSSSYHRAGTYPSSRSRAPTSHAASLARPPPPSRIPPPCRAIDDFGCFSQPHGAYPRSTKPTTESIPRTYTTLPVELSLFDPRPRQTLLQDVEFILGKKLRFPFMEKCTSSDKKAKSKGEKGKKGRGVREGNWI